MNILYLDNNSVRTEQFRNKLPFARFVQTSQECIDILCETLEYEWNVVFLDCNLKLADKQEDDDTGMRVVDWIVENNPFIRQIIVQSMNIVNAEPMVDKLISARYRATHIPFPKLIKNLELLYTN